MSHQCLCLAINVLVGLAKVATTLGVTNDAVVAPTEVSIAGEVSPVNAPDSSQYTFCAERATEELA